MPVQLVRPYWVDNPDATKVRIALGGVVFLSLCTTGVSVAFNFLGRDFFNALSSKDEATFYSQLVKYLAGFAIGIPVFVFRDYFTVRAHRLSMFQKRGKLQSRTCVGAAQPPFKLLQSYTAQQLSGPDCDAQSPRHHITLTTAACRASCRCDGESG